MILCCANAIPLLFEQVAKKGNTSFKKFRQDQLLFLDFSILDLTSKGRNSRNRIIIIKTYDTCLLLKQPRKNLKADKLTLQKEWLLTEKLKMDQRLKNYVIEGFGFDDVNTVFFRQYEDDVLPISDLAFKDCQAKWKVYSNLGNMLGTFHEAMQWPYSGLNAYEPLFESIYPSILLAVDLGMLPFYDIATTPETRRYLNYIARKENARLADALRVLAEKWDSNRDTLIHGDVRFENILSNLTGSKMLLIDWELSMRGDVAWDISALLHHIVLSCYDFRKPVSSFDAIRNNFAFFWLSYSAATKGRDSGDLKQRIVAYCGVRICDRHIKSTAANTGWDARFLLQLGEDMIINDHVYSRYFL